VVRALLRRGGARRAARADLPHAPDRASAISTAAARSGSGGRNTHVTCSCGWTNTSNTTRREQDRNFREHVQDAVRYGLFVVEEERYAPRVVSLHGAASAVNAVGTITDETMRMLRTLVFGDEVVGSSRRERMVTVRRRAMPLIPVRSTDPS
jgi:hypothetical protein